MRFLEDVRSRRVRSCRAHSSDRVSLQYILDRAVFALHRLLGRERTPRMFSVNCWNSICAVQCIVGAGSDCAASCTRALTSNGDQCGYVRWQLFGREWENGRAGCCQTCGQQGLCTLFHCLQKSGLNLLCMRMVLVRQDLRSRFFFVRRRSNL